jgi:hypothetical protein
MNEQVENKGASFFPAFLYCTHMKKDGDRGRHRMRHGGMASSLGQYHGYRRPARSVEEGLLDGNRQRGEKGEGSCARPAGKKSRAHSAVARRCSSGAVGVASVSLGTDAQGGEMPRADGSELRLRVMTADTAGGPGGK